MGNREFMRILFESVCCFILLLAGLKTTVVILRGTDMSENEERDNSVFIFVIAASIIIVFAGVLCFLNE